MLRPLVMGVLNVTPDSFSDGGLWADPEAAIAHGFTLVEDGADIVDVGGESTRPGATRPLAADELDRVLPVVGALSEAGIRVSIDTMRAEVAAAALDAGAAIVNDVSGGLADAAMLPMVAERGVTYIAMHWRAHSENMSDFASYPDGAVAGVRSELAQRVDAATAAGVDPARIVLDPGLGFAKRPEHDWDLLRNLDALASLGHPLLVGASRKSFLGRLLAEGEGVPRPTEGREHATAAITYHCALGGVWGVRVHDVLASHDTLAVFEQLAAQGGPDD